MERDLWDSVKEGTGCDPLFDRETAGPGERDPAVNRIVFTTSALKDRPCDILSIVDA